MPSRSENYPPAMRANVTAIADTRGGDRRALAQSVRSSDMSALLQARHFGAFRMSPAPNWRGDIMAMLGQGLADWPRAASGSGAIGGRRDLTGFLFPNVAFLQ